MVWPPASGVSSRAQSFPSVSSYRVPQATKVSRQYSDAGSAKFSLPGSGVGRLDVGGSFASPAGGSMASGHTVPLDELSKSAKSFASNRYASSGWAPSGSVLQSVPGPPMASQGPVTQTIFLPAPQATPSQLPGVSLSPSGSPTMAPRTVASSAVEFISPLAAPSTAVASHLIGGAVTPSSPAGSIQVAMKSSVASTPSLGSSHQIPRNMIPGATQKVFSSATQPVFSGATQPVFSGATQPVFSGATQPASPVGLLQARATFYGEALTLAPTASTSSMPARVDVASLDQRSPTPLLMQMPASPLATTSVAPSSSVARANIPFNSTGSFAMQTRPPYMSSSAVPYDLPAQRPPSLRAGLAAAAYDLPAQPPPSLPGLPDQRLAAEAWTSPSPEPPGNAVSSQVADFPAAKKKVSDRLADLEAFKSHEPESYRSARERDEAEQALVGHVLLDVEKEDFGHVERVYKEFREEQLDNRLAYLEHILASVQERPGGTQGLTEAEIEEGPLSWDARDFSEKYLATPLYGFYINKWRIGQREAQLQHQFDHETHPWIYMLAGKSRQDSFARQWLLDHQAWRFNEAFTEADDVEDYYNTEGPHSK
mmetsp:Transcript_99141/g.181872  ORF Transcript_99141/g.181872 Transcript_99141/m.181872 type:complete len:597 (-) Transcript_99141:10-1800(-)